MLYTHDVTGYLSRCNNSGSDIHKKDQSKQKHFEKIVFLDKSYITFYFLSLCVFISIQNIGRSIPLNINKANSGSVKKQR